MENWNITSIDHLIDFCLNPPKELWLGHLDKESCSIFVATLLYVMWNKRNEVVFSSKEGLGSSIVILNRLVEEAITTKAQDHVILIQQTSENWKPPPFGLLKVNTDASFLDSKAAGAFVIRDSQGKVVRLCSHLWNCSNAHEAEVRTLEWASKMLEEENLVDLMWSSDDLRLVKEISKKEEPSAWNARGLIIQIRQRFYHFNWPLNWNHRSSNGLADWVAKLSLRNNVCFDLENVPQDGFHEKISSLVEDDIRDAGLLE